MKRTIIIGDTHGCTQELGALLDKLNLTEDDRLISVGDLFHKGPDVQGVVRLFKTAGAELVAGNHELGFLNYMGHELRIRKALELYPKQTPKGNPVKNTAKFQEYLDTLSQDELDYVASAQSYIEVPEHGALVIHGGIQPCIEELPPPNAVELGGKAKKALNKLARTRFVGKDTGKMLPLGTNGPEDPFWADVYDGRFGHVYFGHDPSTDGQVRRFPHATALDTGCVHGESLTAAVLVEGEEPTFVSVPAQQKYCASLYDED